MRQISLRLSSTTEYQLEKLSEKLQINQANVIRQAIAKLAEQEGIAPKRLR